jgi:glyoxylase-like metal-dependent hydrolase (beta-lactamase superfamily II)
MITQQVVPGVYRIPLGVVNAFLLDADGLTLVDTGTAGSAEKILSAVREIGRKPEDVKQILVTHSHGDHSGSLAALKRVIDAPAYMHPADAALVRAGKARRPWSPAPGLMSQVLFRLFVQNAPTAVEPAEIEHELSDGDELPIGGGLRVIHVPGHCAGQLAFLWTAGGVLFAADVAGNPAGRLGWSVAYEDLEDGKRSLKKLGGCSFEVACFGHGRDITSGASDRFRQKWGGSVVEDQATTTRHA